MPELNKRQNLLFSATFNDHIKSIAKEYLNDYIFISTRNEDCITENIEHILEWVTCKKDKVLKLHERLQKITGSVISKII